MARKAQPLVGIIMGSQSDWETMEHVAATLRLLGVAHEAEVVSAHRTPRKLVEYASSAAARGLRVVVAGAVRPPRGLRRPARVRPVLCWGRVPVMDTP